MKKAKTNPKVIKVKVNVELDLDELENEPLLNAALSRLQALKHNINNHLPGVQKDKWVEYFEKFTQICMG